jgi:hypothetical protein
LDSGDKDEGSNDNRGHGSSGSVIERIKGHPQQNGRHERMHLALKKEATRPPGANSLQQQARLTPSDRSSTQNAHMRRSP